MWHFKCQRPKYFWIRVAWQQRQTRRKGDRERERGWKEHTSRDEFVTWQRNNKARKKELAKSKKNTKRKRNENGQLTFICIFKFLPTLYEGFFPLSPTPQTFALFFCYPSTFLILFEFVLVSFRFVSASSFLPFCGLFTRHIFHKNESSELATYLHTRQVCVYVCVWSVCENCQRAIELSTWW